MKQRIISGLLIIGGVLMLKPIKAQFTAPSFGKGIFNVLAEDSSFSMNFAFRFQTLYIAEYAYSDSLGVHDGTSNFLLRRSRLKFKGHAFSPKLKYKAELGLTNRDISGGHDPEHRFSPRVILDAVIKWNFAGNFTLWAGQTKLPGNRERVISSGNLQFVNRSLVNSRYNIDRDIGLQLRHYFDIGNVRIKEMASFSQGEGRDITAGNIGGYDWTGRIEILPFGPFDKKDKDDYIGSALKRQDSPKLVIAATYDYHDRAVRERGQLGSFMYNDAGYYATDINTLFLDMVFKYKGWSMMAEYADKQATDPFAKNTDGTLTGDEVFAGTGLNVQIGYLLKSNWEIAGRYTNIQPDDALSYTDETQYTLGISKYVKGHKLKVQSDFSYLQVEGGEDELMARFQIDIHF